MSDEPLINKIEPHHVLFTAFGAMTLAFILAYIFYAEPYDPLTMHLSRMGNTVTRDQGNSNTVSFLIFSGGCLITGILVLLFSFLAARNKDLRYKKALVVLGIASGIGLLLLQVPEDVNLFFHDIGATLSMTGLWMIATVYLFEAKNNMSTPAFIVFNIVLHSVSIFYIFAENLHMGVDALFQKLSLLNVVAMTIVATRFLR